MADLNVALRVVARDLGSREVRRALGEVDRAAQGSNRTQQRSVAATARAVAQTTRQTNSLVLRDAQRLHQAREVLGVRSEKSLQREIVRTAVAYKRLEQSGRLSGQELGRAADAASSRIRRLQGEMVRLNKASGGMGKTVLAGGGAIVGGVMAGAAVARAPLSKVMDYDRQIAVMSNTAYAGRDVAGRQAGQGELKSVIRDTVKHAGGTRASAADALNELFSTSGLSREDAINLLPGVQRFGLAVGHDGGREVAGLVGALNAQGIAPDAMPDALGKLLHAAQTSGFGTDNMMAALPRVLQAQRENFGVSGMAGLEAALANLTGITAATAMPQEAAQSYAMLLHALKNPAMQQAVAEKLRIDGRAVDWQGTLAKGISAGVDPLETVAAMLDASMTGNHQYAQVLAKLRQDATAGHAGPQALEELSAMLENTVLRDVGLGRSEMLALSAFMQQRKNIAAARADYAGRGAGVMDVGSAVVRATASEKTNAARQAWDEGRQRGAEPFADVVGDVSVKLAQYANQYPGLTASLVAATDAIKVMTAAALVFGGVKMLAGGRLGAGMGAGAAGAAAGAGRAGVVTRAGKWLTRGVSRAVPWLGLGVTAVQGASVLASDASRDEKGAAMTQLAGQGAGAGLGAWGGAVAGAAAGSFVPVIGTAIGGVVGAIAGGLGGGYFGDGLGNYLGGQWFGDEGQTARARMHTDPAHLEAVQHAWMEGYGLQGYAQRGQQGPLQVDVKVSVDVENGNIVAAVNEANAFEARRH